MQLRPNNDPKDAEQLQPEPFVQSTFLSRSVFETNEEVSATGFEDDKEITDGKRLNMLKVTTPDDPNRPPLLHITAQVEQADGGKDMWIRRIQIAGGYFEDMVYRFKTSSGAYADADSYNLASVGENGWVQPEDALKHSQGQMYLTAFDKPEPTENFVSSPHKEAELVAGPVDIKVRYTTSNHEGVEFNHLDLFVSGFLKLSQQPLELSGVLAEDAPKMGKFDDREAAGPQEAEQPVNLVQGVKEIRLFR